MANHESGPHDRFVDEHLAALEPADPASGFDPGTRLAEAHARQSAWRARRIRWAGASVAAAVVFVAVPGSRAFGVRCVKACVNVSAQVAQLWRADEPAASTPRVVGATLGDIAPDDLGADRQGQAVRVSSLRGQVVVVNFWATWCAPCRAEVPMLNDLQARLGSQGLTVIGVAIDAGGWTAIRNFASATSIDYGVALAGNDVSDAYGGIAELPATIVIDRNGLIVVKHKGPLAAGFDDELSKLLGR